MVENFVETVEATLPPEATIVKTIGDEVMVVSPEPASLTEWAVGLLARFPERPQPRVGIHCANAVYRDGDYFGTHVNLAHRVVNRAQAGRGAGHRPGNGRDPRPRGLSFEPIGEVNLKGFPDADAALRRPRGVAFRIDPTGAGSISEGLYRRSSMATDLDPVRDGGLPIVDRLWIIDLGRVRMGRARMLEQVREDGLLVCRHAAGGDALGRSRLGLPARSPRFACLAPRR